ncbi:ABC transporter permease [Granulosicoccaceae sp. 1_MG-2023]|nr:ABC transporter permease [Granulosicoccaceae sp. 1_MG-2023]
MSQATLQNRSALRDVIGAFELQSRVIGAIILRETKSRYGEHRLGFLWVFIEPVLFVLGFAVLHTMLGARDHQGMTPELFMLTGLLPYMLFRDVMSQVSASINGNRALLAFPQVTTFDLIVARALLELGTVVAVFAILVTALVLAGQDVAIERPLALFGSYLLAFGFGIGVGAVLAAVSPFFPSIKQLAAQLFGRPMFFTSGVFFTAGQLPESVRNVLLYNPLLHVTEWSRSAFFASFESQFIEFGYMTLFCLSILSAGLMLHSVLQKRALAR